MAVLLDKAIIMICCCIIYISTDISHYAIIPIIITLIISGLMTLLDQPAKRIAIYILFLGLCLLLPNLLFFLPLILYDIFHEPYKHAATLALFVLIMFFDEFSIFSTTTICATMLFVYLLKIRNSQLQIAKKEFYKFRNEYIEANRELEVLNKDFLQKQDYEITSATLNERNRIAREIHDTVGHLLTSSILQIGALLAITKDNNTKEHLVDIKETLSTGMDSIRSSIHNLYEDSVDLELKLNEIVDDFKFGDIDFKYNISTELPIKARYAIIFIAKECLTNVSKHSNATNVSISLNELPILYQFIISDNGTDIKPNLSIHGMGISSILERVQGLGGHVTFNTNDGFKIFISIPKISE